MKRYVYILSVIINIFSILNLNGQGSFDPDLNGVVTWLDSTHISVVYDWSDDSQLLDWEMSSGASLVRENGYVTVTGGSTSVRAMIWKQRIKCSMIIAEDAAPLTSAGHLNFYSNLVSFSGHWLPDPGLGAVLVTYKNFWAHDGVDAGEIGAPYLVVGEERDYVYTASTTGMTIKSSIDNIVYSYNASCDHALDRKVALGGYGGNTKWGKITIEGEVSLPWQLEPVPDDVINIQNYGDVFAPVIEVIGSPDIEWIFDDSTTSTSARPVKDYGIAGPRHNYLKVTPWSALTGINVGYDAGDGGYGDFDLVTAQDVLGFNNLDLAAGSLRYICANNNKQLEELDLRGMIALEFVELFKCTSLVKLRLDSHPVLERLSVEDCNLDSLDISGCPALEDFRAAVNNYKLINWGSIGQELWHICIRDNPQFIENIPVLTQFPALRDLYTWNDNQSGSFVCHSTEIRDILSYDNHYTSADISSCTNLFRFWLSGSQLTSINMDDTPGLYNVELKECSLNQSQVDYVLITLDEAGMSDGALDLTGNAVPSDDGLVHYNNLTGKGWTIQIETDDTDPVLSIPADYNGYKNNTCLYNALPSLTGQATATDNSGDEVTINYTDDVEDSECSSTITRVWLAEDKSGNSTTGTQTIMFMDNEEPLLSLPADYFTDEENMSVSDMIPSLTGFAIATDNCDTEVEISYADEVITGEYSTVINRTWKAEDNCGNNETNVQTITLNNRNGNEENEPLKIIIIGNLLSIPLSEDYISWKAELSNSYGVLISSKYVETNVLEFDISGLSPGIYILVLSNGEQLRVAKVFINRDDN